MGACSLDETCQLDGCQITAAEAEAALLDFLRDRPGHLFGEWFVLNRMCSHPDRGQARIERRFFLKQMNRLVREKKIIRYRKGIQRGKIRISEAFVGS